MDIKGNQNVTFSVIGKLADFQVRSLKMETSLLEQKMKEHYSKP